MSEQDERSAFVALTEHQIRLLLNVPTEVEALPEEERKALWRAREQLKIALYALSQG